MKGNVITTFLKKHWIHYVIGTVFLVLSSYIQSLNPKLLGNIIDALKEQDINTGIVLRYLGFMIIVAILAFITRYIWRSFIIGVARNLECYLRQQLFKHFQLMSVEFYNNRKTGDLMAYAINDISAIRMAFGPGIALVVHGLGMSTVAILSMISSVNLRLTLFALTPIPVIIFAMIFIGRMVQLRFKAVQETFAAISDRVQENISGIRVIKSYVQEKDEVDKFDELNKKMRKSNVRMVRISSLLAPMIEVCFGISFMISLIYGSGLVRTEIITLGDFVAFNGYLTMIMAPIISIGRVINISQKGIASFKRLNEIFKVEPDITDELADNSIRDIEGSIEIKNLTFSYPGTYEPALKDINVNIEQGKTLGIIGKTGSGKTTLMSLLLKLYNVDRGKIFIDGKDINDYPLEVLREKIGYVPQDNFLFSSTIKDNINFFKNIYTDEEIEEAAKLSCIYDSIADFPYGFKTVVGERGVNLSGGQKQRISIARAVVKRPSVLILDDSLSAVDNKTEENIIANFDKYMKGKTAIVIAHRISVIKDAHEIIVMDQGEVVERGTHDELIEKRGAYYDIYQDQFKEETRKKVEYEAS